jgi:hypothetical protein
VSVIEPGPIDTPIWRKSAADNQLVESHYSPEVLSLYGRSIEKFKRSIEKAELGAAPVSVVLKAVEHAVLARSPRTRYPVGAGVGLMSRAAGILPDSWMDQIIRRS